MKIIFTRHARGRMRWRKITAAEIITVINSPDRKERLGINKYHFHKSINNRYLRITLVIENNNLIVLSAVDKKK